MKDVFYHFSVQAGKVAIEMSDGETYLSKLLSEDEAAQALNDLLEVAQFAQEQKRELHGADEWSAKKIDDATVLVSHDFESALFGKHVARSSKVCKACSNELAAGDVYWRQKPGQKKPWSRVTLCDSCVRPELRAQTILCGRKLERAG